MKLLFSSILILGTAAFSTFGVLPAAADTQGTFVGASDHITTGGVTVTKNADGTATVTLADDFSLDGAPDPRVGFGKDGSYVDGSDIGLLKSLKGGQSFVVPASVNVDDFNEIYIWCLKFAVPLGVAQLG
jgi:hypothetical protein